ncbi:MAG: hypothetical protein D6718_06070 [Acidobacteria bacterium]|nr:MAG: hypothetical protein D6718_06070 [Acidobacteriota bacterium]
MSDERIERTSGRLAARRTAGYAAAAVLGCVLLLSAWTKGADPEGFAAQIVREGLLPGSLAGFAAVLVVALEAGLGAALLAGRLVPPVLAAGTALMGAFWLLAGWQFFVPPDDPSSCGCFGNLIQQTPGRHWALNTAFLALAALSWLGCRRTARGALGLTAGSFAVAAAFALAAPSLPIDSWPGVTRLREGADVAELGLTDVIPELAAGDSLVLLIDRADEETRRDIGRVNELLALKGGPVRVFGLAERDEELAAEFFWAAGPAFDVREAPYSLIKPLYRRLPRAFLVREGRIRRIWNGIPDEPALERLARGEFP